jgi:hypothetical protein
MEGKMPWNEVMGKFGKGDLHSGSKEGPKVTNPKQAVAIMYSEKGEAKKGKEEYKSKGKDHLKKALGGY